MEIKTLTDEMYYKRLERAKVQGRYFYNSLDTKFKQLPININEIVKSTTNWGIHFDCLYGEEGYTLFIKNKNKNKSKYKICIESYGMAERKRFTTAHEVGHIVLGHFEKYYCRQLSDYEECVLDKEADMFAGEILMPFEHMIEHYNWSIKGLTYRFHVSREAARVRLNILESDPLFLREINRKDKNHDWSMLKEFNSIVENFYKE